MTIHMRRWNIFIDHRHAAQPHHVTVFELCTRNIRTIHFGAVGRHQVGQADPFGRQVLPGEAHMDGFFYAVLHKSA